MKNPARDNSTLLRVSGLNFGYDERPVLKGVDFEVPRGKVTAILGPTACGKSTLLDQLCGQAHPASGTVEFDGINVHALNRRDLYKLRLRMGRLFQANALLTDLSVFENVAFPLREHTDLPDRLIRTIVLSKLEIVGLRGSRDLFPHQLSGGMMRRVGVARAISMDPDLVMYDEPFAGLDPISLAALMRLIRGFNDALDLTSIVVSHCVEEAFEVCDYAGVMIDGQILARGTPDEVRASTDERVQQFLKGESDGPVHFHYPAPTLDTDFLQRA